jgi:hypothetical protein
MGTADLVPAGQGAVGVPTVTIGITTHLVRSTVAPSIDAMSSLEPASSEPKFMTVQGELDSQMH